MNSNKFIKIVIAAVLVMALCALSSACVRTRSEDKKTSDTTKRKTTQGFEDNKSEVTSDNDAAEQADNEEESAELTEADQASDSSTNSSSEETKESKATDSKKTKSSKSKQKNEKKKVWVEPVYETRTVKPNTGTRYCQGANSGGGCGASWSGTKDDTYNSWKNHWQDYVKRRTAEEAEKGNTYVCDHIHDDSRWEPDPEYTEQVLVKDGYWKEVG